MLVWGARVAVAAVTVTTAAACGGGDDGDGRTTPPKEPAARCTPAGSASKSITVKPKWKIGDRRAVHIQKSLEDTELDTPVHSWGSAELRVVESDRSGALLRWTSGPVSFPAATLLVPGNAGEIAEDVDPLRIEYATDRDGVVSEIGNLSSLRTQVAAMLDAIAEHTDRDDEVTALRRIAESDAFLQTAMVEDLGNLHFLYGITVEPGETVRGEYELPNPFGGDPVPSALSYTLTTPRDRSGCAVFDATLDADPDAIAKQFEQGFGQLGQGDSLDASELEGMRLRHELSFSYDPGSGWIARADARKIIELRERRRTERTLMITR